MKHKHQLRRQIRRRRQSGFSLTELLIVITIIGILSAVAVPALLGNLRKGRETAAISSLQTIHKAQISFNASKNRFGTLKELADAGLLSPSYAAGQAVSQYVYKDDPSTSADGYCVHADRSGDGAGDRDFTITTEGRIFFIESSKKGTVPCGEGTPLENSGGGTTAKPGGEQPK